MRVLDTDVIENLMHSSSVSKGIERTMEHLINELAMDSMYVIHYEEGLLEPCMAYEWENIPNPHKVKLQVGLEKLNDSYHFEEDDMFVVEDRATLDIQEEKLYEEIGYRSVIEFQMRRYGKIIGYIFLSWINQRSFDEDELEEIHVLLKLMNDQMIKQFYQEITGGSDGRLFRLATSMTQTMIYVLDDNYKILFANDYAKTVYPDIKPGICCYDAFRGEDCPCRECILEESPENGEDEGRCIFLPYLQDLFMVNSVEFNAENNEKRYLLTLQRRDGIQMIGHRKMLDRKFIFSLQTMFHDVIAVEIRRDLFYNLLDEYVTQHNSYSVDFVLKWLAKVYIDDRQKFLECFDVSYLQNMYMGGVRSQEIDFRYRTEEGKLHYMNGKLLFDSGSNKDIIVYIMFQDVEQTRSARIEEYRQLKDSLMAARSAAQLKGEVLANISNEILTPMGGIISMSSVAKQVYKEEDKLLECLANIDNYAEHMMNVMDSLLETVNVDHNAITIAKQTFRLEYLLNRVDIAVREGVEKKNIQFFIESKCRYRQIVGDEIRIYQVLCTLIQNAISYIPISGELRLAANQVAVDGKTVYIRFILEDTGNGLNDKVKESIFGISHQAESGFIDEEHFELSLAAKVIRLMGGEIGMEVAERGTKLYFTLPFGLQEKEKTVRRKLEPQAVNFKGKHLLLAEDSEMARESMLAVLEVVGFEVDSVENGRQAVIQFVSKPAHTYDAVLMDIHMPFMDGREAARCIRISGKEDGETVPIIGLMTNTYDEDVEESLQAGMQEHLSKPVDVDKLYRVLRHVILKEEG